MKKKKIRKLVEEVINETLSSGARLSDAMSNQRKAPSQDDSGRTSTNEPEIFHDTFAPQNTEDYEHNRFFLSGP